MGDRGDFRSIYTVLGDDPDFQELGPDAQLVWFHLKLKMGPAGIDTFDAPEAVLEQRSGIPSARVADAMRKLSEGGWLVRQRNILWLRNALRYEPSRNLATPNHRKSIENHLATLPKLAIVNEFAAYYQVAAPFPDVCHADGMGNPSPSRKTEDGVRKTEDGEQLSHTAREAKPELKAPPHPIPESEPAPNTPDDLASWLGACAAGLDAFTLYRDVELRTTLLRHYGPPGMRPNAWKRPDGTSVPTEDRPRIFALAAEGYAAEGKAAFVANEFAGMLRTTIRSDQAPATPHEQPQVTNGVGGTTPEIVRQLAEKRRMEDAKADDDDQRRREAIQSAAAWLEDVGRTDPELHTRALLYIKSRARASFGTDNPSAFILESITQEVVEELRAAPPPPSTRTRSEPRRLTADPKATRTA